ncbi:hypothetical protein [Georgenia sp. SUBG003]|uniref:hypothetical protein n=1 Tax=Georgenia sp. SUBG003 TaxID=1497974 RepID=UPI003AB5B1B1
MDRGRPDGLGPGAGAVPDGRTRGELLAAATDEDGKETGLPGLPNDVGRALAEMRQSSFQPAARGSPLWSRSSRAGS